MSDGCLFQRYKDQLQDISMISLSPAIAVHLPTIKCQGSRLSMPMLLIFFFCLMYPTQKLLIMQVLQTFTLVMSVSDVQVGDLKIQKSSNWQYILRMKSCYRPSKGFIVLALMAFCDRYFIVIGLYCVYGYQYLWPLPTGPQQHLYSICNHKHISKHCLMVPQTSCKLLMHRNKRQRNFFSAKISLFHRTLLELRVNHIRQ